MEIQERTQDFGVKIIKFGNRFPSSVSATIILKQLIRSGTSIGANMEEADGAASKKDFVHKVIISRKEARETRYWLQLLKKSDLFHNKKNLEELEELIKESNEFVKILSSIISKTKTN